MNEVPPLGTCADPLRKAKGSFFNYVDQILPIIDHPFTVTNKANLHSVEVPVPPTYVLPTVGGVILLLLRYPD